MGLDPKILKGSNFDARRGIQRQTEHKERPIETDWRRWIPRDHEADFLCIYFPNSFDAENLSVCNENPYELTFLSRVLST